METTITQTKPDLLSSLCRTLAFSLLKRLSGSGLLIREGNEQFYFGEREAGLQAELVIHDLRTYRRLLFGGSIGAAEAYVDGDWQSPDLVNVIRIFARNLALLDKFESRLGWLTSPYHKLSHQLNRNSKSGSRANIAAHYDLGNEMYQLFLDPLMQYSSAIYPSTESALEEAQEHKLKAICEKLDLQRDDHLLEIGTGWGGLAFYAAKHYGCKVTTTTLSQEQYDIAKARIEQSGLDNQVTLLLDDYRDLTGQYDKLVSIEMIEAVGHEYLPTYFKSLEKLLKPNGRMLIQAITIADQRYDSYRKNVDFIQRYIFPGGCLPSVSELCRHLKQQTSMTVTRLTDHGLDYAQTLKHWAERFKAQSERLHELGYSGDFQRLWDYYFSYCEGGFREGTIGLVHFEAAKPEARVCRNYSS